MQNEILIIGPAYPLRGGIANFNEALCKNFISEGIPCSIISFTLQYPKILFPGKTQFAENDPAPQGINVTSLINSVNPVSWFKTARHIRKVNPRYVIVRYWLPFMAPSLGVILRLVQKGKRKVPVIAICDNIIPHEKRPGDSLLTRFFLKSCDAFVVMSESVKNDLYAFDTKKPIVINPHPVYDIFGAPVNQQEAQRKLNLDPAFKYVLFFGFIRHYKGLDILLNAFADEQIKAMKIKLIVAGEFYEDKKTYLDLIKKQNLEDTVVLHDHYISKEDVKYYFCAADIVAQPYRDATQSGVTQIAYHFSKPMVVTNVGGLPEMVPDGIAGYVTDTNAEAISVALKDFFNNNKSAGMTAGVEQFASNFTWKSMIEKIEGLVKNGDWK